MPLVRIDLRKGKDGAYRQKVGRAVYEAMRATIDIPDGDRFVVINEHEADNFQYDPDYLGVRRTDDLIIVQIIFNTGRSVEKKKALYSAIADGLAAAVGLRREDVLINVVEVMSKGDWSFGNGIAQYLS